MDGAVGIGRQKDCQRARYETVYTTIRESKQKEMCASRAYVVAIGKGRVFLVVEQKSSLEAAGG